MAGLVRLFRGIAETAGTALAAATHESEGARYQIVSGKLIKEFGETANLCSFAEVGFGILALVSFAITLAKPRKGAPLLGISVFATYLTHNLSRVCQNGKEISGNLNNYRANLGVLALAGKDEPFEEKKLSGKFLEKTFHFDWAGPFIARVFASSVLERLKPPEKRRE